LVSGWATLFGVLPSIKLGIFGEIRVFNNNNWSLGIKGANFSGFPFIYLVTSPFMTFTTSILLAAAGVFLLSLLLVFLRSRKSSLLAHRYSDALLAENNGDVEQAIQLYQEALGSNSDRKTGDKHLIDDMEQRLKTLRISTEFEKSFRRAKLAIEKKDVLHK